MTLSDANPSYRLVDYGPSTALEQELLLRAVAALGKVFWLRDGQMIPLTLVEIARTIQEFEPRYAEVNLK